MAKQPKDKKHENIAEEVLIREVDDEMRAERLQEWWSKFGSMLVAGCVVIVLATVAYQIASSYRASEAEENVSVLLQAQSAADKGQIDTALQNLKPLKEKSGEAAELAKLQSAYLDYEKSETVDAFKTLASKSDVEAIESVAKLQANEPADSANPSAFYPLQAEQKAVSLIAKGERKEARTLLLALLDRNDLPTSQRERLNELLQGAN